MKNENPNIPEENAPSPSHENDLTTSLLKAYKENRYNFRFREADELIKVTHVFSNKEIKFITLIFCMRKTGQSIIKIPFTEMVRVLVGLKKAEKSYKKTYFNVIDNIVAHSKCQVDFPARRIQNWQERGFSPDHIQRFSGNMIRYAVYDEGTDLVEVAIEEQLLPLLDHLDPPYTWLFLDQIIRLNNKYAPRLYQWARMHLKSLPAITFLWYVNSNSEKAPGIRQWMNLPADKYTNWYDLNRWVIAPAVKEINSKLNDLHIHYTPVKKDTGSDHKTIAVEMIVIKGNHPTFKSEEQNKIEADLLKGLNLLEEKVLAVFADEIYSPAQLAEKFDDVNQLIIDGLVTFTQGQAIKSKLEKKYQDHLIKIQNLHNELKDPYYE